ncbi:MAG: LptA/OstA family protein [Armatimonadota bacterium]|nr:LptA/OstA family protein [Armatimonadota bacterium]
MSEQQVVIGIDAHKRTHTMVAVDAQGRQLGERTVAATIDGHMRALEWAGQWPSRRFAVEDCRHVTRRLEGDLLTMAGAVRVEARRGVAEGDRLEARLLRREVTVWGSVRLRVDDMDATADRVSLLLPAQQAVLTGQVRLTQQGRTLWAQRVTVDYGTGRVVAEGPLRLTIPQEQQP